MKTLPLTNRFAWALEPPRNPALTPDGVPLLLVGWLPDWIVPAVVTAMMAGAAAEAAAGSLADTGFEPLFALMPELPALIELPENVVTTMLPGPRLSAPMP